MLQFVYDYLILADEKLKRSHTNLDDLAPSFQTLPKESKENFIWKSTEKRKVKKNERFFLASPINFYVTT